MIYYSLFFLFQINFPEEKSNLIKFPLTQYTNCLFIALFSAKIKKVKTGQKSNEKSSFFEQFLLFHLLIQLENVKCQKPVWRKFLKVFGGIRVSNKMKIHENSNLKISENSVRLPIFGKITNFRYRILSLFDDFSHL